MPRIKDGFSGQRALVLPPSIIKYMEDDAILSVLYITDIGYYPRAEHHFRERKVPISQYVFIYCIDGGGWYMVDGKRYTVSQNQYFILPAGVPHAYGSDEDNPWTIYWIHFNGTIAPHYAQNAVQPMDIKPEIHSRISNRINLFEEIYTTLKAGYSNDNLHYASSLFHYYLGSLRYIQQYRRANVNDINDDNVTEIAIHYMKEHLESRITLKMLSEQIGYSTSHFTMLFKQKTGHSPLAYFNLLKIQEACAMLDSTDMKINQICFKIGIEDTFYFSRLFSKTMGMSPREYRKTKKG